MTGSDPDTLHFYASEAVTYINGVEARSYKRLDTFLALLNPGSSILELGCGGGTDSAYMLARGFDVTPTDGSPEIAAEAQKRLGRPVAVLHFDQLDDKVLYDGVWANACLLHVPRSDLPAILRLVHGALKPGGVFFASYKGGTKEGRDKFGRYYNYLSAEALQVAYGEGWSDIRISKEAGSAYDGKPTEWLYVIATKSVT
ncbi:class I SAM-dependent methyltransferase [Phyllobacterium sp. LjRoot231]|uniref:class I SAM-dependent methyltransferase n=1 Tax=Phyllobacterium sp. LjRoot231 TaxID=3342289 RepID=UPI003ECFB78C